MIGWIKKVSKQLEIHPEADLLSYFFCQATNPRLKSIASIFKGLIYLLAIQNRILIQHIQKTYNVLGPSIFNKVNKIFLDIVKDLTILKAYLMDISIKKDQKA